MPSESITTLGEKKLIKRIIKKAELFNSEYFSKNSLAYNSFTAIGDDTSLIDLDFTKNLTKANESNFSSKGSYLVATSDMILKHSHFPKGMSYFEMGWKSVIVNISDLAAMGASPIGILLSIAVPKTLSISQFDKIIDGVVAACSYYEAPLIGGDTNSSISSISHNSHINSNFNSNSSANSSANSSDNVCNSKVNINEDEIILSVTALGHVEKDKVLMKFGFEEGDYVAITGELGLAALGFELLNSDINNPNNIEHKLIKNSYEKAIIKKATDKILNPVAKLLEGKKLKNSGFVTAATDITDGLASELYEMVDSNLRANIMSNHNNSNNNNIINTNNNTSTINVNSDNNTNNINNNTNIDTNNNSSSNENIDTGNSIDNSYGDSTGKNAVSVNDNVTYLNLDSYFNSNNTNNKNKDKNNNGILGFKIYEELIPRSSAMKKVAKYINKNPIDLALYFGEDFELLFTFKRNKVKDLKKILDFHVIGEVVNTGAVEIVDKHGNVFKLSSKGYEHSK